MHEEHRSTPLSPRTVAVLAGLMVFLSCAWFMNTRPGWNVLSQFALTCALVEEGSFKIDAYHEATNDKAYFGGHYYSDKSPVTPALGVPALMLYRALRTAFGSPVAGALFEDPLARYFTTLFSVGLCAALLSAMLAKFFLRRGISPPLAAAAAALWVAATPLLGYSIIFFNYAPACALALAGYLLIDPWLVATDSAQPLSASSSRAQVRAFFLGGLLLGLAAWTLNTLALAAVALTAVILLRASRDRDDLLRRRLLPWAVGGICGAAGYALYTLAIFGSLASPYAYEFDPFFRDNMARGFMGATWPPRPLVAWLVTFHPFQGLFIWFPVTLLALTGTLCALRPRNAPATRRDAALALAIFLGLLLYNSAYFLWWGGWAYAPRHLIPALPFLALGLVPLLRVRAAALFTLALATLGAVFNIAAIALDPQPPPGVPNAIPQEILLTLQYVERWPSTFYSLQNFFWRAGQVDENWGLRMGLTGRASLLPLLALWIAFALFLLFVRRRRTAEPGPPQL